jgi:hypothetical protein
MEAWRPVLAGIVVACVVVTVVYAAGVSGILSHAECVTTRTVGQQPFWTPFSLVNTPYLGSTHFTAEFWTDAFGVNSTVRVGPGVLTDSNLSWGYFETQNWTVYAESNVTVFGPGVDSSCQTAYSAVPTPTAFNVGIDGVTLQGSGNISNAGEPTSFNDSGPQAAAVFVNGFETANRPAVSTCGGPATELNFTSVSFHLLVTLPGTDGSVTTVASVSSLESFTYFFPADSGTWSIDDLQVNNGLSGPGLAFSWQSCQTS